MFQCDTCGSKTEIESEFYNCEICNFSICDRCEYNCQLCGIDLCSDCIVIQGEKDDYDYLCESCTKEIEDSK